MSHTPVMLNEVLNGLNLTKDSIVVDLTLGRGGHSKEILKRIPNGHLYAFDQDEDAIKESKKILSEVASNFTLIHDNFITLNDYLAFYIVKGVDAILIDLGVSSPQFDKPDRGFSYRFDGPLDMRMDQKGNHLTAEIIVNTYSYENLVSIFREYGEHKFAHRIARKIIDAREVKPLTRTLELVDVIKSALPMKELKKVGHPAKTIFQALRIEVNDELNALKDVLVESLKALNKDGRLAVITFHSLEDRITKHTFSEVSAINRGRRVPMRLPAHEDKPPYELVNRRVIIAKEEEIINNPRAKSAKLRIIKRNGGKDER